MTDSEVSQRNRDAVAFTAIALARQHTDVKGEAQRRIIVTTGASDLTSCLIKQMNALMRATELTNKKASGESLTTDETAEATKLQALADAIKATREASNVIEAMAPIPADFANDKYWQ